MRLRLARPAFRGFTAAASLKYVTPEMAADDETVAFRGFTAAASLKCVDDNRDGDRAVAAFRGFTAAASLKYRPRRRGHLQALRAFRGFTAAASLKSRTPIGSTPPRSTRFPRFHRRGLIEVMIGWCVT